MSDRERPYCPLETVAGERPYILFKNNCILLVVVARGRASSCARTIASGSESEARFPISLLVRVFGDH